MWIFINALSERAISFRITSFENDVFPLVFKRICSRFKQQISLSASTFLGKYRVVTTGTVFFV